MPARQLPIVFAVAVSAVAASLPSYVTVCPKNDPELDTCFVNLLEKLRPQLKKGIPEMGIPAIDPLELSDVKVSQYLGEWNRVLLKNIRARGAGEFSITRFNINLKDNKFSGRIQIPNIDFEGDYSADAKFMQFTMEGNGTVQGRATNCSGDFLLIGDLEERNHGKYFHFKTMEIFLNVFHVHVSVAGLIDGELDMGDAVTDINGAEDLWIFLKPVVEDTMSDVVLEIVNNIAKHVNADEIFP